MSEKNEFLDSPVTDKPKNYEEDSAISHSEEKNLENEDEIDQNQSQLSESGKDLKVRRKKTEKH